MKTFISILILLMGVTGIVLTKEGKDVHRSCTCSGTFCSCDATCLDEGEIPSCTCGTFSCVCKCNPKDANSFNPSVISLPTINSDQVSNSIKAESYFRLSGSDAEASVANALKSMRESIQKEDINGYSLYANLAESAYAKFTPAQKSGYEVWAVKNLKK